MSSKGWGGVILVYRLAETTACEQLLPRSTGIATCSFDDERETRRPRTFSSSDIAVVPESVSSKGVACSCSLVDTCAFLLAFLIMSSLRLA